MDLLFTIKLRSNVGYSVFTWNVHPQNKKISWCVSSQPHNFRVITQDHGLIEQVKGNLDYYDLPNRFFEHTKIACNDNLTLCQCKYTPSW